MLAKCTVIQFVRRQTVNRGQQGRFCAASIHPHLQFIIVATHKPIAMHLLLSADSVEKVGLPKTLEY